MDNKARQIIALSVGLSLIAHVLFFVSSKYFVMSGMHHMKEETRRLFKMKTVEEEARAVDLFDDSEADVPAIKMSMQDHGLDEAALQKMQIEEKTLEDMSLKDKKEQLSKERLEEEFFTKEEPRDIMDAESKMAKDEAQPETRYLTDMASGELVTSSGVKVLDSMEYKMDGESFKWSHVVIDAQEGPSGGDFEPGSSEFSGARESARSGDYQDIDEFLDITVHKYIDPASGEKYFRLDIRTKKGIRFRVIPKEVIFLIDSSKSITADKLSFVKDALLDSLDNMNPDDRFNVVAFRGDLVRFRERSVKATGRNIRQAKDFVGRLEAIGQTDVDNALLGIVDTPLDTVPSYIILVTDGRPTTGVTDSRRIIQEITRHNDLKRPVFCFGGGARVNRYLLDFISYQNRGWSRFADRTYEIEQEFNTLYDQVKDPLLLNLRYRLINLEAEEVYPKYLPDFFKDRELTLYGRFDDEDVFSMQLLGEIGGQTKELIFKRSLSEAEDGGEDIARQWAFRKIYYLISRDTLGANDKARLLGQIDELSRKYNIITPYNIEETDG